MNRVILYCNLQCVQSRLSETEVFYRSNSEGWSIQKVCHSDFWQPQQHTKSKENTKVKSLSELLLVWFCGATVSVGSCLTEEFFAATGIFLVCQILFVKINKKNVNFWGHLFNILIPFKLTGSIHANLMSASSFLEAAGFDCINQLINEISYTLS